MDERTFLERLRARRATSRDREPPPLPPMPALGMSDLLESFERNGITFQTVAASELSGAVAGAFGPLRRFACWKTPLLSSVPASLVSAGMTEIAYPAPPADPRPVIEQVELGIVEADVVIAETGSIGLVSGRDRGLLAALFARKLVAVTTSDRVISRLDDIADWLSARPVNLSLISGPSRTGDVAQKHILGAHGPAAIHVLVLK
jgi:L-lactate utilization protein LutC